VATSLVLADDETVRPAPAFRKGSCVAVRGRPATFVKAWGARAAIVRYDSAPDAPKVVPLDWISSRAPQAS
jgi:hypothetical protein